MSAAGYPAWLPAAAWAGAALVRLWGATWQVEARHEAPHSGPVIYVFWHARLLALTWLRRGEGAAVLVSRHADGEIVARLLGHLGYVTARGSSTRGGGRGMLELHARVREGRQAAITPDGPRGPARVFKSGAIYLASRTGLPLVSIGVGARRAKVLRSWDGFRVPLPFTRLGVVYGAPQPVPPDLAEGDMQRWCARAGADLDRVTLAADALAGARA